MMLSNEIGSQYLAAPTELKPMLARDYCKAGIDWSQETYAQPKYNGHRCLITNFDGMMVAVSREGFMILSADHILQRLSIAPGITLDGELYCHGATLGEINGMVQSADTSYRLTFVIFDVVMPMPFAQRFSWIQEHVQQAANIEHAQTWPQGKQGHLGVYRALLKQGYEGMMVRVGDAGYESGRTDALIRLKPGTV